MKSFIYDNVAADNVAADNVAADNSKPKADAKSSANSKSNSGVHVKQPDLDTKREEEAWAAKSTQEDWVTKPTPDLPLVDFLRRTNNAGLHPKEPEDEWELIGEAEFKNAQDKDEWTLIGKTVAEKAELEKRIAEHDERRTKRAKKC
jgi:hypothetical protein